MNLLLLGPGDILAEGVASVAVDRHAARAGLWPPAPGRELRVGIRDGRMGSATVESVSDGRAHLQFTLDAEPPPPLALTLLLALPRPKMLRRVLRSATELGIKRIYLLNSSRVEKSFWGSPLLAPGRLEEYLVAGLEQARDTVMPLVEQRRRLRPFVEDELPAIAGDGLRLIAHPGATSRLPQPVATRRGLCLAIGPEGGFTDFELGLFGDAGFGAVSLGTRILRVETALPALVAALAGTLP